MLGQEEHDLQPAGGTMQSIAPKEQHKADGRNKARHANSRLRHFDHEQQQADKQNGAGQVRRSKAFDQQIRPIWLNHSQVQVTNAAPSIQQPRVGVVPTPAIPGMIPLADDDMRQVAPAIGEHGPEILRERGYDDDSIDNLIAGAALFVRK